MNNFLKAISFVHCKTTWCQRRTYT